MPTNYPNTKQNSAFPFTYLGKVKDENIGTTFYEKIEDSDINGQFRDYDVIKFYYYVIRESAGDAWLSWRVNDDSSGQYDFGLFENYSNNINFYTNKDMITISYCNTTGTFGEYCIQSNIASGENRNFYGNSAPYTGGESLVYGDWETSDANIINLEFKSTAEQDWASGKNACGYITLYGFNYNVEDNTKA